VWRRAEREAVLLRRGEHRVAMQIADRARPPRWVDTELLPVHRDVARRRIEAIEKRHCLIAVRHTTGKNLLHIVLTVEQMRQ
jgi:hypothetical protein